MLHVLAMKKSACKGSCHPASRTQHKITAMGDLARVLLCSCDALLCDCGTLGAKKLLSNIARPAYRPETQASQPWAMHILAMRRHTVQQDVQQLLELVCQNLAWPCIPALEARLLLDLVPSSSWILCKGDLSAKGLSALKLI